MTEGPTILGGTAIKPIERHGFEKCRYFCYDPDKGTVMGRTGKSWALITIFYLIYYACLSAFWLLMMYIFFMTIRYDRPRWIAEESLIGTSPGLGLRPEQPDATIDSSMIIFNKNSEMSSANVPGWGLWKDKIDRFLVYYDDEGKRCNSTNPATQDEPCNFNVNTLGDCAKGDYGYSTGQPCLYFKLNKIYGVSNDHYNGSDDFPEDMPDELIQHIRSQRDKEKVWVDCHGENPADVEAMGKVRYFPNHRGLPGMYFPYTNQLNYRSPMVAVQFMNPRIGQLIHIECRAWAKNIGYDRMDRIGMVHFELFMFDNPTAKEYEKSYE